MPTLQVMREQLLNFICEMFPNTKYGAKITSLPEIAVYDTFVAYQKKCIDSCPANKVIMLHSLYPFLDNDCMYIVDPNQYSCTGSPKEQIFSIRRFHFDYNGDIRCE